MTCPKRPSAGPAPGTKQRLFRLLALAIVPVLLLACELGLRLGGYGYPTSFFIPASGEVSGMYRENPKFGWRFFPRALARTPEPIRLLKHKPAGTYRIFIFGESAALGDPEPAYSFSRILRELLEARFTGSRFEVINVGMTAISSQTIREIAHDCAGFEGDLWIIYMGNNEVIGPFGPGSAYGAKAPSMPLIRATLLFQKSRVGQWLDQRWQAHQSAGLNARQWEGMKMMLEQQIRATDPVLQRVYRHFRLNLENILVTARGAGAKTILCSVASNLQDCPPFLSLNRSDLSEKDRARWKQLISEATESEKPGTDRGALALYRQAAEIDGTSAELRFRMGRCQAELGNRAGAQEEFTLARDWDAYRFRCDSAMNGIIRDCSKANPTVQFLDCVAELAKATTNGVPGVEEFWDHVHFNFAGNYWMARQLAEHVLAVLPQAARSAAARNSDWISKTECAQRLAYTPWDERAIVQRMSRRMQEPPFTSQLEHEQTLARLTATARQLNDKLNLEELQRAVSTYHAAIAHRPNDWMLHHRLGFLLEAMGDNAAATAQWQEVVKVLPEYVDAWFKLGDMDSAAGKLDEAEKDYRLVLKARPNSFEAMNGLGLVSMSKGRLDEAQTLFARALKADPSFAQADVNWGLLLLQRGNAKEAEAHYRNALRSSGNESAGAHINLANLLASQGKQSEAVEQYLEAVRLQPYTARVRVSLANSLMALGRTTEGEAQYGEAIRLDPTLAEAHFNLGVALAKKRDLAGATACFREAARLNPQDPQAFLNLGVALAQQSRIEEAATQFQTVLRLDPANVVARRFLETAMARQSATP